MATVTATAKPAGLDAKKGSALIRTAWAKDIVYESLKYDVMSNIPALTALVNPGKITKTVPGKVIMDVTPSGMDKYARSVVLQRTSALSGDGKFGSEVDDVLGNEEDIAVKYFKAYAADWAHAVRGQKYGFNYRENTPTQIFDKTKPLLAQWYGELDGLFMRQGLTRSISENLEKETALDLDSYYNSNVMVINSADTFLNIADYDTEAAYETAVLAALGGVSDGANSKLTITKCLNIAEQAADSDITPIQWEGHSLYIMYAHPDDVNNLIDPSVTGSFGESWVRAAGLGSGELNKTIPGAEFVVGDSLVVVKDRRAPRFHYVAAGDSDFAYLRPGRKDERKGLVGGKIFNVAIVLGENALVKFHPEPPHYEDQDESYRKYNNVGFFGACGYMSPVWQNDEAGTDPSPKLSSRIQESSMLVLTAARVFDGAAS